MAHDYILESDHEYDLVVAATLLSMFATCGTIDKSRFVFDKIKGTYSVTCWNAMIAAYAHGGCCEEALSLFKFLLVEGIKPNHISFICALSGCSELIEAQVLYHLVQESGLENDVSVTNALVSMYGKCGSLTESTTLFRAMPRRDAGSWKSAIAAHAYHGRSEECVSLLSGMREEGFLLDKVTFLTALNACADPASLKDGALMHEKIVECGLERDTVVASSLINMYGRCGCLKSARDVFAGVKGFDVILWTGMLTVYCQHGQSKEARQLFRCMLAEGLKPTSVTFTNLIISFLDYGSELLFDGVWIHSLVQESGMESDPAVALALIDMYTDFRRFDNARSVFDSNKEKTVALYTNMLAAYVKGERGKEIGVLREHAQMARELFREMQAEGLKPILPTFVMAVDAVAILSSLQDGRTIHRSILECGFQADVHVATALVDMYGKCGDLESAEKIFQTSVPEEERDMVLWTAMMGAFVQHDRGERAVDLFNRMLVEGLIPSYVTLVTVMNACAGLASEVDSKRIHDRAREMDLEKNTDVANGLVDMYGKVGSLSGALDIFERLQRRNVISWNAMIAAYKQCGQTTEILFLVRKMQQDGYRPDSVTFVSLLSVCSHVGLMDEAHYNFIAMRQDFGLSPSVKHYSCMIDLLARAGELQQAENFISRIPQASCAMWMTLLGACRHLGDTVRAKRAATKAIELEKIERMEDPCSSQDPSAAHVALANICASAGKWDEALSIRKAMVEKGLRKEAGRSLITVKNRLYEFVAGDCFHPRKEEIYAEVERLERVMRARGHTVDTGMVTHNVGEAEKKRLLCYHSEKLAVAFGILSTPPGTSLRIIKNLRACNECHTAIKLISGIEGREIVVRDSNRFHHFNSGSCSCGDYW